jgi:hypothetical protein
MRCVCTLLIMTRHILLSSTASEGGPALQRKTSDTTRTRRSCELHLQLRKPLTEWYQRLDLIRPDAVLWQLPRQSADLNAIAGEVQPRDRYDLGLLDALVDSLPATLTQGVRVGAVLQPLGWETVRRDSSTFPELRGPKCLATMYRSLLLALVT